MTAQSERITLEAGADPMSFRRIRNRETGRAVAGAGTQSLIIRTPARVSDPAFLTRVVSWVRTANELRLSLADGDDRFTADLAIRPDAHGLAFDLSVRGPEPLWMAEWTLTGLDLREIILPALGGQSLGRAMPVGTTLTFKYPFWWNAQFAIGQAAGGGIWLHTRHAEPRFTLLRVRREAGGFSLTLGFEATGPLGAATLEGYWHLDCYAGSWKVPVERYRTWMEQAFQLVPLEQHPYDPPWARDVRCILELWGMAKDRPTPLHTFDQMRERLSAFARMFNPHQTLLYLPGYAEHGIDSRAPSYEPSPFLGGDAGFARLVNEAHGLGFRVMIHTNVLAMTFDHPLFPQFRDHQVVDVFGRPQSWGLDIDGDWLAEPYFAYINPGVRAWGDLMERTLKSLVDRFGIDAIFLDQTLLAFNTGAGPNFLDGMRNHILRLQEAMPGVLFAGEGYHELVARALPMAQIHGIDSIAEVHGMEGRVPWRTAHPVLTTLFGNYTRFTAHLLTKHPTHPMFAFQERAYGQLGVLPALCLYNDAQRIDLPAIRRMLRRASKM